ncbi:hypothetical protein [Ancylobacter rudongensis]|nr:hypothetical protein [Ancylobacter rudongensis]
MKVISIWQPFAELLVRRYKVFETRSWAPPRSCIGLRMGIASTKTLRPEQRAHFNDPEFQAHYSKLGLPERLEDLSHGYLLGTAVLDSYELITAEFLEDVSDEEQQYGWFNLGGYAWRMVDPIRLEHPVPIRGAQGIYEWKGQLPGHEHEERPAPV